MGGRIAPGTGLRMLKHPQTERAACLASFLTSRDRKICLDLYEHKVLTTHQVVDLYFDSQRVAERRLLKLFQYGVVLRFRPVLEQGSSPHHFVLGDLGAYVVAAELGVEVKELRLAKDRLAKLAYSPRLAHLVASNDFFSRLVRACRDSDDVSVTHWWGEDRTRRRWGQFVWPDAFGQLQHSGRKQSFFLELDLGTERPWRLAAKLDGYRDISLVKQSPGLLLFCFPDHRREASARKALKPCGMTVATSTIERHSQEPLGENWLALGASRRASLLDLNNR